ncbi:MAG: CHAT domain-containing protein [Xenococcaceae cyanobacterium MO_207.B15]|nr:CHAT domain-containing protein [Xenococcaceae cyanobacterium MO_207.B15]
MVIIWLKQLHFPRNILENNPQNKTHREPSKQAVIENLADATLVHIACHGIFEYNRPDQSGLVLVANSNAEILSLRELSNLDLTQLRHATLSSCWAADHFVLPGRWIISVPETLWRSGTQSILGCLWQVSDKVAVPFMADFYENLKRHPRDKALQLTQLKCLKNQLPDCHNRTDNLFFWAGFNLYGDYCSLKLPNRGKAKEAAISAKWS